MNLEREKASLDTAWAHIQPFVNFASLLEAAELSPIDLEFLERRDSDVSVGTVMFQLPIETGLDKVSIIVASNKRWTIASFNHPNGEVFSGSTDDECLPSGAIELLRRMQQTSAIKI